MEPRDAIGTEKNPSRVLQTIDHKYSSGAWRTRASGCAVHRLRRGGRNHAGGDACGESGKLLLITADHEVEKL
jgi:hypothetical protein